MTLFRWVGALLFGVLAVGVFLWAGILIPREFDDNKDTAYVFAVFGSVLLLIGLVFAGTAIGLVAGPRGRLWRTVLIAGLIALVPAFPIAASAGFVAILALAPLFAAIAIALRQRSAATRLPRASS